MIILVNSSCSLYRQSWSEEIFCRSLCLMVVTWFICRWIVPKKNNRFFITKYLVTLCTNLYSEVSNNHTLSVYLFPRKILPFVFISLFLNSTMAALCIYLVLENSLPFALFPYCTIIRYSRIFSQEVSSCVIRHALKGDKKEGHIFRKK